jgi:16S rRNA (cytosine967-C5)-methyltransferase
MEQSALLRSQLRLAAEIWPLISASRDPADRWLGNYFHRFRKKIGSRDRRFLSELIYGCFRRKSFIEAWGIRECRDFGPQEFVVFAAVAENLISEADFECVLPSSCTAQPLRAGVYRQLKEHRLPENLSSGSLEEKLAVEFSTPVWLVKRWLEHYGEPDCRSLLETCGERPPLVVRVNPIKVSRESLIRKFRDQGHHVRETPVSRFGIVFDERAGLFDSGEFREGFFEIQDEGSQILCEKIDPQPGQIVWDVCAGGGGKSLALAALMANKGRIIATDIRKWKLDDLKKRASRAGVYNIFPADIGRMAEIGSMKEGADIILVDAPCSGTGTFRRNPDAKWKLSQERLAKFPPDQTAILERALPHLKKCGKLYYATCSLEPDENENVVAGLTASHPELVIIPLSETDPFLRLMPHRDGTDGFFLAAFKKNDRAAH